MVIGTETNPQAYPPGRSQFSRCSEPIRLALASAAAITCLVLPNSQEGRSMEPRQLRLPGFTRLWARGRPKPDQALPSRAFNPWCLLGWKTEQNERAAQRLRRSACNRLMSCSPSSAICGRMPAVRSSVVELAKRRHCTTRSAMRWIGSGSVNELRCLVGRSDVQAR